MVTIIRESEVLNREEPKSNTVVGAINSEDDAFAGVPRISSISARPVGEAGGLCRSGMRAGATPIEASTDPPPSNMPSKRQTPEVIEVASLMQHGSRGLGGEGLGFEEEVSDGEDNDNVFEKDDSRLQLGQSNGSRKRQYIEDGPLIALGPQKNILAAKDEMMIRWLGFDEYCRVLYEEPNGWLQGVYGGDDIKERIYKSSMKQGRQKCVALYTQKDYEALALEALQQSSKTENAKRPRYRCKYCHKDFKDKKHIVFSPDASGVPELGQSGIHADVPSLAQG